MTIKVITPSKTIRQGSDDIRCPWYVDVPSEPSK